MQNIGIILWAVAVMVVLNVLIVALTIGVKTLRVLRKRSLRQRTRKLEEALDSSLASGEIHPRLRRLGNRNLDLLAVMMIEYLSVLRGAERDRISALAEDAGLTERYFRRLASPGRWRKARAAENLGYFGGPRTVAPLAKVLAHPDETLRAVAARSLARIGTPEAVEALAKTLNDPSELTRLRMAENLERVGSPSIKPLIEVLEKGNEDNAEGVYGVVQAAQVLGQLRAREARPALGRSIRSESSADLRAKSALALGKIGDPDDVPTLLAASEDEAWSVRAQAASALGMIGEVSSIPSLKKLTVDREWWVRLNASRSLANMGPTGERALADILENEDRYACERAAATLEERGITLRAVEELVIPGERGAGARAMIQGMVHAGAVKYLQRLARTLPDENIRLTLQRTLVEARES